MTEAWPPTPPPPHPFAPEIVEIRADEKFFRVHPSRYRPVQFNPGFGAGGRFHFFGHPRVPVLYMATTREAAVAETLLHDLPVGKASVLQRRVYEDMVMSGIRVQRTLQIALFHGFGLRRLGVQATQLTDTPTSRYPMTRLWSEAAHRLGLDGVVWMSRQLNSDQAYVLFGDRVAESELEVVPGSGLVFAGGPGFEWLVNTCVPLHVDVTPR